MFSSIPFFRSPSIPTREPFSALLGLLLGTCIVAGCGSASMPKVTPPPQLTSVTVLMSSIANDQFTEFNVEIASIMLTNKAGGTVTLMPATQSNGIYQTQNVDFVHLNAATAPLLTATVPEDIYTSAALTYTYTQFTYVYLGSTGGVGINTDAVGEANAIPIAAVVNLPSPITVNGTTGLLLTLQVPASATLTRSSNGGPDTYSIKPTFTLTAATATTTPPSQLAKVTGLDGRITATDTANNSFTLRTVNGYGRPTILSGGSWLTVVTNTSTVYHGVQRLSDLAANMFVNLDLTLQSDGSLLATRVEVDDPNATNVMTGPLLIVYNPTSPFAGIVWDVGRLQQGSDLDINPISSWDYSVDSSTAFKTSEELTLPSNLPFSATFNSVNMVAGQYISISSLAISSHVHATTITLRLQTIDGTVTAVSSAGTFAVYTVNLAAYDLFPTLAVQPGQTTALQNPGTVEVFTDSLTRMLNSSTISPGSPFRFHGLIFNDNGSLRMYCNQVNDGVPE